MLGTGCHGLKPCLEAGSGGRRRLEDRYAGADLLDGFSALGDVVANLVDVPLTLLLGSVETIMKLVTGDFSGAWETVGDTFGEVGGDILDAVLDNLAMRAKVVICGAVSQYDDMDNVTGPSLYLRLAERQASMEGFAYFHFPESIEPAQRELAAWLDEGSITLAEEILDGIERYPEALQFMFRGGNTGKLLVKAT